MKINFGILNDLQKSIQQINKTLEQSQLLMPQAKRSKLVSLTQVKPKEREHKQFIVNKVHTFMTKFKYLYILSWDNMSTNNFKGLKQELTDSKFMMGKNGVLKVAFGTDEENSFKPHTYRLGEFLKGHVALFFTNKNEQQCKMIFDSFEEPEFATGGTIATETIILRKGFETLAKFSHSIQPHLRSLGLPTRLINSKIELTSDYVLAEDGKPLTVDQCKLLKLMDHKMARLKFEIKALYDGKSIKTLF